MEAVAVFIVEAVKSLSLSRRSNSAIVKVGKLETIKVLVQQCELRFSAGSLRVAASGPLALLTVVVLFVLWRVL
jgi:hypothetical protein